MKKPELDIVVAAILDSIKELDAKDQWAVLEKALEQATKTAPKLIIKQDTDPAITPREESLGLMVCWHGRYKLGDEQPEESPEEWYQENVDKDGVCLPLYLYDHSGITMATSPFACNWDSGQVGWVYMSPDVIKECYEEVSDTTKEWARKVLELEVKDYDCHLRGSVWGFEFGDDSCWGFVGDELEDTGIKEYLPEIAIPQLEKAWEERE